MTWEMPLKTLYLYVRENGYRANMSRPPTKRKATWTLSDKEMIDAMPKGDNKNA